MYTRLHVAFGVLQISKANI